MGITSRVTTEHGVSAERGVVLSITGPVDISAVNRLQAHFDAAVSSGDTDFVVVDLARATHSVAELFTALAGAEAHLRAREIPLIVTGLHRDVLVALDDAELDAVFTLYRAARQRGAATRWPPGGH